MDNAQNDFYVIEFITLALIKGSMMKSKTNNEQDSLDLQDLLVDGSTDVLSDYLSISLEPLSDGTKVNVTTVEDQPATYSSTLTGVTLINLDCLIDVPIEL